jgi:hypothetical protein
MKRQKRNEAERYNLLTFQRIIPIISILLMSIMLQAQDVNKIQKVIFHYKRGGYNFGQAGIFGKQEILGFTTNSNANTFTRKIFLITERVIHNPLTNKNDSTVYDTTFYNAKKIFKVKQLYNLIEQLNIDKDNFSNKDLQPLLKPIKTKEIMSIAKRDEKDYWFTDKEGGKIDEFGREIINKLKNYDMLDSFLVVNKPDKDLMLVGIDGWNYLNISFVAKNDTTQYRFDFQGLLGQPYIKRKSGDLSSQTTILNSDVNEILLKFCPKNLSISKQLSLDLIKEKYIAWYINAQMWDIKRTLDKNQRK